MPLAYLPLNPLHEPRFVLLYKLMLPNPQHPPARRVAASPLYAACPAQGVIYESASRRLPSV
jgi:hypothetical protein